jgi:hypothetical protein
MERESKTAQDNIHTARCPADWTFHETGGIASILPAKAQSSLDETLEIPERESYGPR